MKNSESFNLTRKQKIIIAVMILVAFLPPIISNWNVSDEEFWLKHHLRQKYNGVITEIFIDYNNHSSNSVKFKNGKVTTHFHEYYDYLQIGDSLVKDRNSVYLFIYRNGHIVKKQNLLELQLNYL